MAKLYEHTYQRLEYSVNQQLPYSDSFCTIWWRAVSGR
jgi:hypothetical protein